MKRIFAFGLLLFISLATALAQPVSYPLANGKVLKITNLLQDQFHPMFNNEALAAQLSLISEKYELDTNFELGFNPSDTRIFFIMQSIRVLPENRNFRPKVSSSEITMSLHAHASIVQAMVLWFISFTNNSTVPQELRTLLLSAARRSTQFMVATDVGDATISVTGNYDTTRSHINFDPAVQFRDVPKMIFTTINMPRLTHLLNLLSGAGIMTLELPENPANPGILRDSWHILNVYGLR